MVFLTAFYAVDASGKGSQKPLRLQRYNKKMTYASLYAIFLIFLVGIGGLIGIYYFPMTTFIRSNAAKKAFRFKFFYVFFYCFYRKM